MSKGTRLQAMAIKGKKDPTLGGNRGDCAFCETKLRSTNSNLEVCDCCGSVYEWLENGLLGYIGKRVIRGAI